MIQHFIAAPVLKLGNKILNALKKKNERRRPIDKIVNDNRLIMH